MKLSMLDVINNAKHIRTGKIKDITYDQARGYEPIEDTPIKRLSRELGRMLLPQR